MRRGRCGMINQAGDIFCAIIKQYRTWRPSVATKNILYHLFTREQTRSFGTLHQDTIFYVIRSIKGDSPFYIGPVHNLLANYFYVLSHLQYAKIKGYIPIVDQQNYPVYNCMPYPINGTLNAWEYFWQQPCDVSLEKVYCSKCVVLSQQSWFGQWDMGYDISNYTNTDIITQYHQLSESVPLNPTTAQYVQQAKDRLFVKGQRILGICYRFGGHAKNAKQGQGHPISPEIDDLLSVTRQRFHQWGMEKIFLASDEETIIDSFRAEFHEQLIVIPRNRMQAGCQYDLQHPNRMYEKSNLYETTLSYLTEMELLASCDALIGSVNSGLRYAIIRKNGRYEHMDILDRGLSADARK